ncbi:acrylyl-CoA reductase family protein [Salinicoccus sp. Marseille-QA3877]
MNSFKALVADKIDGKMEMSIKEMQIDDLTDGEVLIDVHYSSVNYKDGMVASLGEIADEFPIIPGIDLAGEVIESSDDRFKKGDAVIATSYKIGTGIAGGFSQVARIPADWIVPLPDGLTLKESMELGTAGLTAGISIKKLETVGMTPDNGPVLVAGATGGTGSLSVNMLAASGYEVVASTGSMDEVEYLKSIGAAKVIHRDEVTNQDDKPVGKPAYQAAIDPVGGKTTEYIIKHIQPEGALATFGLVAGIEVNTTVLPFIGRGIHWVGADSVNYPMKLRKEVWERLASDLKPDILNKDVVNEVTLEELPQVLHDIIEGKVKGRTIVNLKSQ